MLSPSIALLISIAIILSLIRFKVLPCFAVFAASLIVSLLVLPPSSVPRLMLQTLLDTSTLSLLAIIASTLALSRLMEMRGLLTRLAAAMEKIGPKLAIRLVPAVD